MRSIYIQAKLNKLEHENAVILFKVMDGGSEYCLLECVRPSTGDVEPYTILSFQKFIFGVYVQSIWCVCVCTCTYMPPVYRYLWWSEEHVGSSGAGATGVCEPSDVGAGNQT